MPKHDFARGLSLWKRVSDLVENGALPAQPMLEAMKRFPPPVVNMRGKKPKLVEFPEDHLMQSFYKLNPEARLEPIWLNSTDPPKAKQFALRQMFYMQKGYSKKKAYHIAAEEFVAQEAKDPGATTFKRPDVLQQLQQLEEAELQAALKHSRKMKAATTEETTQTKPQYSQYTAPWRTSV